MRLDNVRHEIFARRIAEGEYASRAYKLAGYRATGHSAEASASRLLKKVDVQARISELRAEADMKSGSTLETTFTELAQVAFANPFDHIAFDEDGDPYLKFPTENREQACVIRGSACRAARRRWQLKTREHWFADRRNGGMLWLPAPFCQLSLHAEMQK
jgi:hypothetical protein